MFKISDKVVCVDDRLRFAPRLTYPRGFVELGVVYVVRSVDYRPRGQLVQIVGKPAIGKRGSDIGYWSSRFRKLEDIKEENRKKQEEPQPV